MPRQRSDAGVAVKASALPVAIDAGAITASVGEPAATIAATSAGPVTTPSSNTIPTRAYAVSRRSRSWTSIPHSERIAAGTCGISAPPHTAHSASIDVAAWACAATTSAISAGRCPAAAARRMRVCPYRSISRPCATAPTAFAMLNAPTMRPASAKEPVASWTSSRIASPNIPIGIDAVAISTTGAPAPGIESSSR
jgi:hypothetical protein